MPLNEPVLTGPGAGRTVRYGSGSSFELKLAGEQAAEDWAVVEWRLRAGDEPPIHTHTREDETLYVLEGTITAYVGDERIDVVVVRCGSPTVLSPCLSSLEQQTYRNFDVTVATSREEGLRNGSAPYVVFLEEEDVPDNDLLSTLVQARRTTQADVVTCGLRLVDDRGDRRLHFFSGEPAGLGAVGNQYGNVALLSRERLGDFTDLQPPPRDQDWPLLAGLAGSGARIVSVPVALVERRTHPGTVEDDPVGALVVIRQLEHALPEPLAGAARLAAGLAMAQRS